jgi:hypothetical protein
MIQQAAEKALFRPRKGRVSAPPFRSAPHHFFPQPVKPGFPFSHPWPKQYTSYRLDPSATRLVQLAMSKAVYDL